MRYYAPRIRSIFVIESGRANRRSPDTSAVSLPNWIASAGDLIRVPLRLGVATYTVVHANIADTGFVTATKIMVAVHHKATVLTVPAISLLATPGAVSAAFLVRGKPLDFPLDNHCKRGRIDDGINALLLSNNFGTSVALQEEMLFREHWARAEPAFVLVLPLNSARVAKLPAAAAGHMVATRCKLHQTAAARALLPAELPAKLDEALLFRRGLALFCFLKLRAAHSFVCSCPTFLAKSDPTTRTRKFSRIHKVKVDELRARVHRAVHLRNCTDLNPSHLKSVQVGARKDNFRHVLIEVNSTAAHWQQPWFERSFQKKLPKTRHAVWMVTWSFVCRPTHSATAANVLVTKAFVTVAHFLCVCQPRFVSQSIVKAPRRCRVTRLDYRVVECHRTHHSLQ